MPPYLIIMTTTPTNAPPRRTAYSVHHRLEMDFQSILSTHSSSLAKLQFAAESRRDSGRPADDKEDDMIRANDGGIQQQIREVCRIYLFPAAPEKL